MKTYLLFFLTLFVASNLFAGSIAGKVIDKATGEPLAGANVYLKGTTMGAATDQDGMYYFKAPDGVYTLVCNFVGYADQEVEIVVKGDVRHDFALTEFLFTKTIEVLADRAKERETPVAFTNIEKEAMEARLGSRDIPLVLNTTPSVYATQQGGGAGDARINVRGFNQRNVAIMINGVPVNDMENGWVYWSNWDGVGDATASIQVQRGLSAINLATPSIGGTMNVITDPTKTKPGLKFKQEYGTGMFLKTTVVANTGLIANKFAFNAALVRKTGDGLIDKTWTDAWAYYLGASWDINKNNRIEIYALGAPQRHGQNLYKQNIAVYDSAYAAGLSDYDPAAFSKFKERGREYNQNWAPVNPAYKGKQAWNESTHDRYSANFINERENFFHKPIVNLNWYSNLTDRMTLYNVFYYSGGHGGGTGTYGKVYRRDANGVLGGENYKFYYGPSPWIYDWDQTIEMNRGPAGTYYVDKTALTKENGQSLGILRNSRNNQWTIGAISKINYKVSDHIKSTIGIDWRKAEIDHYREVRDLLGGEYYIDNSDEFNPNKKVGLGDKIAYYFTNDVDWLGGFVQAEYSKDRTTAYGMFGYSGIKYSYLNHFKKGPDGGKLKAETDVLPGYQIKGGVSYRSTDQTQVYANAGYVSKVPIFDDVIDDYNGIKNEDYENSTFTSVEFGMNYTSANRQFVLKTNVYYTKWNNRTFRESSFPFEGEEYLVYLSGVNQEHYGIEFEGAYQPSHLWRLDFAGSIGHWMYTKDVQGEARYIETGLRIPYSIYIRDLMVGDAPQTQLALAGTFFPIRGLNTQIVYRYYARYWSDFNPFDRIDVGDRAQPWRVPDYGVMDLHVLYDLPFHFQGVKFRVFAHVYNVFDQVYIQDATDNSQYNAYTSNGKTHSADDAEVFMGLPRFFNIGISVRY
ncbi:TonB-dependent receptor [Calditrichota bacterium LG25]